MIEEPWLYQWSGHIRHGRSALAFDIGANTGTWTSVMRHWFKSVVSVEPDRRCHPPAGHDYVRNAVSSQSGGKVRMYLRESALQNSLDQRHAVGSVGEVVHVIASEEVDSVTLDDLVRIHGEPDFIKMDIEGGETDALNGATLDCLKRCRWVIELHDTRVEVFEQLQRLGYKKITIMEHPHPDAGKGHEWALILPEPIV
jgi:FkbM family methyltransferase